MIDWRYSNWLIDKISFCAPPGWQPWRVRRPLSATRPILPDLTWLRSGPTISPVRFIGFVYYSTGSWLPNRLVSVAACSHLVQLLLAKSGPRTLYRFSAKLLSLLEKFRNFPAISWAVVCHCCCAVRPRRRSSWWSCPRSWSCISSDTTASPERSGQSVGRKRSVVSSVVDPDPYWIRFQELCVSVFRIRIRIHTCKKYK